MIITEKQVTLRELKPSEGMILTDKETETMRAEVIYLGKEDSEDNYKEIDISSEEEPEESVI